MALHNNNGISNRGANANSQTSSFALSKSEQKLLDDYIDGKFAFDDPRAILAEALLDDLRKHRSYQTTQAFLRSQSSKQQLAHANSQHKARMQQSNLSNQAQFLANQGKKQQLAHANAQHHAKMQQSASTFALDIELKKLLIEEKREDIERKREEREAKRLECEQREAERLEREQEVEKAFEAHADLLKQLERGSVRLNDGWRPYLLAAPLVALLIWVVIKL